MVEPAQSAGDREPVGQRRRRGARAVLVAEAAGLRRNEKVSGGLSDSWRTARRVGRRLVVSMEPGVVGVAGLGHRGAEPAWFVRIRPAVRGRNFTGLVR